MLLCVSATVTYSVLYTDYPIDLENPELVKSAPHSTRISRIDEAAAARKPVLRWKPE